MEKASVRTRSRVKPTRRFQLRPRSKESRSVQRQKKLAQTAAHPPPKTAPAGDSNIVALSSAAMSTSAPTEVQLLDSEAMAESLDASAGWCGPFLLPQTAGTFSDAFSSLEGELGRGRRGDVRQCKQRGTGRLCACKSISKSLLLPSPPAIAALHMELSIQTSLAGHPNIVELIGVYEDPSAVRVVAELCAGGSLADLLRKANAFRELEAAWLLGRVVEGVHACHKSGVVLRSIHPRAVLVGRGASVEPKIADFSNAVQLPMGHAATGAVGELSYMAPEVLCGAMYGPAVDIWSLGVTLYQLLSGVLPFHGATAPEAMASICRAHLDFQSPPWPSISSSVKALIRQMLARDARNRPTTEHLLRHPWLRPMGSADQAVASIQCLHSQPLPSPMAASLLPFPPPSLPPPPPSSSFPPSHLLHHHSSSSHLSFPQTLLPSAHSPPLHEPLIPSHPLALQTLNSHSSTPSSFLAPTAPPFWTTVPPTIPSGPLTLPPGPPPSISSSSGGSPPDSPSPLPPWPGFVRDLSPEPLFGHFQFPADLAADHTCGRQPTSPSGPGPESTLAALLDQRLAVLRLPAPQGGASVQGSAANLPLIQAQIGGAGVDPQFEALISSRVDPSRSPSGTSDVTSAASPKGLPGGLGFAWAEGGRGKREREREKERERERERDVERAEGSEAERESTYDFLCGLHDLADPWPKEAVMEQLAS